MVLDSEVKNYIESNIEYLDDENYYFFLLNACSELSNLQVNELINILQDLIDNELLLKARENVLRFYITMQVEEYADDDAAPNEYSTIQFIYRYLGHYLGYNTQQLQAFIQANQSEWADNMVNRKGEWRFCK